jgi:prepilin-type N-terminal cleavage/methylation domain-containing protein
MKFLQKGFSLVELLVVVAIIGVLAGVGIVGYETYVDSSRKKVAEQNWNTVIKTMEFEQIVVTNDLGSAIKEKDKDGNWIKEDGTTSSNESEARMINAETPCLTFLHSIKEHFKDFRNPYLKGDLGLTKKAITVDTQGQTNHKQGQIQLTCYKNTGGFGQGSGCPIPKARFHVIVYFEDKGRWFNSGGDCGEECVKVKTFGDSYNSSASDAQAECGWNSTDHGAWYVTNNINADANY